MIDCTKVTDFYRDPKELQEFFIFAFAVAGKSSKVTQAKVNFLLDVIYENQQIEIDGACDSSIAEYYSSMGPLEYMAAMDWKWVKEWLSYPLPNRICDQYWIKKSKGGLGKYETWKDMLTWVAKGPLYYHDVDNMLRNYPIDALEKIPGVLYKTSRFFTLHSRIGSECIPLDTHILRYLRDHGFDAPTKTPGSDKKYLYWEDVAIKTFRLNGYSSLAVADLETWKQYSGNLTDPKDQEKQ